MSFFIIFSCKFSIKSKVDDLSFKNNALHCLSVSVDALVYISAKLNSKVIQKYIKFEMSENSEKSSFFTSKPTKFLNFEMR